MTKITLYVLLVSTVVFLAGCASNDDTATEATPEKSAATTIPDQSNIPPEKRKNLSEDQLTEIEKKAEPALERDVPDQDARDEEERDLAA